MARGSVRQRGRGKWELRMYVGVETTTGRQRYVTRTVRGSRRAAVRALDDLAAELDNARSHAGTVGELLQRWFTAASRRGGGGGHGRSPSAAAAHLPPTLTCEPPSRGTQTAR